MTILFLYTELAGYFLAGIRELVSKSVDVHVVRWPVNKEAPFDFEFPSNLNIYERDNYSYSQLQDLVKKINPDVIFSSGWVDSGYLKVCRKYKGKTPTVLTMDNQWHGTIRQYIMRLLSPFKLHSAYNKAWVPGKPQKEYALKLGFKEADIQTGFYSADVNFFSPIKSERSSKDKYPHRLLYVGRYINAKGLDLLFKSWMEICEEHDHDWQLICVGTGELFDSRPIHPRIEHLGFKQPSEMLELLKDVGAFVLPSRFEPWGVVVHEMAASGLPMVVSSAVGSVTEFLDEGVNGYIFSSEDADDLKCKLLKIIWQSDDELKKMSDNSYSKGIRHTPQKWADKVMGYLDER